MNRKKVSSTKLDRIFSEYIRKRDSDSDGYITCATCGKVVHWTEEDAGHFISRAKKATKYDERNVHAQCRGCNRFQNGRQFEMSLYVAAKYGDDMPHLLLELSRETVKVNQVWIDELTLHYQSKLDAL